MHCARALVVATQTSPPEQPVVEGVPLQTHTASVVDPVGGRVVLGVATQDAPAGSGTAVISTNASTTSAAAVQSPPLASKWPAEVHVVLPAEYSTLPIVQDGRGPAAHVHPQLAGPPVGGVGSSWLTP
jgi:hypothetical protein